IFRGRVLDVGTPEAIVARRGLHVAELELGRAREAADALRARPEVDEVAHYGHILRLATRNGVDPAPLAHAVLDPLGIAIASWRATRATVEDVFVSMVRDEDARRQDGVSPSRGRAA